MAWLDSDDGAWAASLLRVAQQWGKPPLTMLAGRPDQWRHDDTLLAAAYSEYQLTRLDGQGRPQRLSEDPDQGDAWDVDAETINWPMARIEEWRKANPEPPAGTVPKVVYHPTIRPDQR